MVVQLDAKEAFDHVPTKLELFLGGSDCSVVEWSCMKARMGTVFSNKVQMSRGLLPGAPESLVICTGAGAERSGQQLESSKSGVESGRLRAGCDLLRRRCGSGCCVTCCNGSDGGRSDRRIERSGTDSWCTENTLDKPPEDDGRKHCGGWVGCVVGRKVGICGDVGVSGWNCATRGCAQIRSGKQMLVGMANRVEFIKAPEEAAPEHCKTAMWKAFLWSSTVWTTVKAQRDNIASWSARMVPLRYECVQTAFVPKTHADAGLFLLLQAAELSRDWQRELVVVQLDVKKAFNHVDHRAAFKAMR